jgi:hypothetical protein
LLSLERNRLWLLKNSLFVPISQNLGDRKCLGDPGKSIVGLPDAILFLSILREGVFQQPRLFTTVAAEVGALSRVFQPFLSGAAPDESEPSELEFAEGSPRRS